LSCNYIGNRILAHSWF